MNLLGKIKYLYTLWSIVFRYENTISKFKTTNIYPSSSLEDYPYAVCSSFILESFLNFETILKQTKEKKRKHFINLSTQNFHIKFKSNRQKFDRKYNRKIYRSRFSFSLMYRVRLVLFSFIPNLV